MTHLIFVLLLYMTQIQRLLHENDHGLGSEVKQDLMMVFRRLKEKMWLVQGSNVTVDSIDPDQMTVLRLS